MNTLEQIVTEVKAQTYPDWNVDIDRFLLEFAHRLIAALGAREPVATVYKRGADRDWMSERLGALPDGKYSLYAAPVVREGWYTDDQLRAAQVEILREAAQWFEDNWETYDPACFRLRSMADDLEAKK